MLTLLYVDDETINLELFEITFMNDFNVLKSISAQDALEKFKKNHIDILITDLKMPGMNGIELIKKIKEIDQEQKCILLTGYYEESIIKDPETDSLIYKYVMKPYKRDEMISLIHEATG